MCVKANLIDVVGTIRGDQLLKRIDKVLHDTTLEVDTVENSDGTTESVLQVGKVQCVQTDRELANAGSGRIDDYVHKLNGVGGVGTDAMRVAL